MALIAGHAAVALAADTVAGVALNRTTDKAAAGDEVILLRLEHGMQEEARTRTDARGAFAFAVNAPQTLYLIRVMHQNVNYDEPVEANHPVAIAVYDKAARVGELAGTMEVLRMGSRGDGLHVSDMVEIRNESNPPRTEAGERTFEVYLPPQAKLDTVLAAGEEKIGVIIKASALPGEPGHYAVNFPLRPGATKFAFNYDLPYAGEAVFRKKSAYPLKLLSVMIPQSMTFSAQPSAFHLLRDADGKFQVEAATLLKAGETREFSVAGKGVLPRLPAAAVQNPMLPKPGPAANVEATLTAAHPQLGWKWLGLGAIAIVLPLLWGSFITRQRRLKVARG
jgi:hypothetical protein